MSSDILKYFVAVKNSIIDKEFFGWQHLKGIRTEELRFIELQKMRVFFMDKKHQTDVFGVSSLM